MSVRATTRHRPLKQVDRLTASLLIDKAAQILLFVAGISAILFILSIIVFVFEQGLEFLFQRSNDLLDALLFVFGQLIEVFRADGFAIAQRRQCKAAGCAN